MQGMEGEAVVYHRETRHNAADAVRSIRPKGKECRHLDFSIFISEVSTVFMNNSGVIVL